MEEQPHRELPLCPCFISQKTWKEKAGEEGTVKGNGDAAGTVP